MAGKKTAKKTTEKSGGYLSAEERAAMRETVKERKAEAAKADLEQMLQSSIAAMKGADRTLAKQVDGIIKAAAPHLSGKTWYGMPAYTKDDKVVVFFKPGLKFKSRYATLGFEDAASLDDGSMWPTSYALTKLTGSDEKKIAALVKKAAR